MYKLILLTYLTSGDMIYQRFTAAKLTNTSEVKTVLQALCADLTQGQSM